MMNKRGFASDNNAGVHPQIMEAILKVNQGHVIAYGDDPYTEEAIGKFKSFFGDNIDVYFVFNGTAANVLGIYMLTQSHNAVICTDQAHLYVDECGAPEKFTGCKLLTVRSRDGKLKVEDIDQFMHSLGFEHHVQPKVVSITQATELGTVYTMEEIRAITDFAHRNNLYVHMDGARIANAAVSLNITFREMTIDAGIDVLSFGGTKNGMMYGEAVIFFNKDMSGDFKYVRKQGMQLGSKMRFIAAQFSELLSNELWRKNARHANRMAKYLGEEIKKIERVKITQPVQSNGIFALVPPEYIPILQKEFFFYIWDEKKSEVRWMTSFDTTKEDIEQFVSLLESIVAGGV